MARRAEAVRRRARRLVEAGGLSRAAVARSCGISPGTLRRWIALHGWAPPEPAGIAPERWQAARRLFEGPRAEAADIALALGLPADGAEAAFAARGFARQDGGLDGGLDGATLRRRLRHHVARQIAVLDAQLGAAPDSARVLRDVAGLKRVIDALDLEDGARGTEDAGGSGPATPPRAVLMRPSTGVTRSSASATRRRRSSAIGLPHCLGERADSTEATPSITRRAADASRTLAGLLRDLTDRCGKLIGHRDAPRLESAQMA